MVTLDYLTPAGVQVTKTLAANEVQREKEGFFFFDLKLEEHGVYQGRWTTSGGVDLTEPFTLAVGVDPIAEAFADDTFTPAEIWARSPMLQTRFASAADGTFSMLVALVAPLVGSITGRAVAGVEGEAIPAGKHELLLQAIARKTEQYNNSFGSARSRKSSLGRGNLASFSAGNYSESYFGPQQIIAAKRLDADSVLAEILWELCTDAKKEEWLALWDPDAHPQGTGSLVSFEYGNRPNYSPAGSGRRW